MPSVNFTRFCTRLLCVRIGGSILNLINSTFANLWPLQKSVHFPGNAARYLKFISCRQWYGHVFNLPTFVFNVAFNFELYTVVRKKYMRLTVTCVIRCDIPFSWHVRMLWSIIFYKGFTVNAYKIKFVTIE